MRLQADIELSLSPRNSRLEQKKKMRNPHDKHNLYVLLRIIPFQNYQNMPDQLPIEEVCLLTDNILK